MNLQVCPRCGWHADADERFEHCLICGAALRPEAAEPVLVLFRPVALTTTR